jgi:hypothetical protein
MSADEKSTDPGLLAAERKALRSREPQEAITDHKKSQEERRHRRAPWAGRKLRRRRHCCLLWRNSAEPMAV